ncbi:hypothetical protein [Undibacterium sp. RuRC25W]
MPNKSMTNELQVSTPTSSTTTKPTANTAASSANTDGSVPTKGTGK